MEAVPRLPMISFPGRTTTDCDELGALIKKYIRHHYHEDAESYNSEIFELEGLRRSAINATTDFVGCSTLKKYYCQLSYLESRFPLHESGLKISFNWCSAFDHNSYNSGDISLEMESILYNIATLHTALGAQDARTTADGMKISCTHFQCSAGAFQTLAQHSKGESELNPLLMNFMMNLSLSQAQECILEKSMTDHRKPNIIAKVSMQVVDYLKQTLKNLESFKKSNSLAVDLVGSKMTKMWQRYCEFKIAYYYSVTYFHQGLQSEEQQKMGERLAYLQGAVERLEEAGKSVKNLEKAKFSIESINDSLTFANDVIRGKLTACQKENEFVYHEKVPALASLPEVKGASLVKGITFSVNDSEVAGSDIFGRLVPIEAHQASSIYSEQKASLLRKVGQRVQEKNDELDTYLASMQLDSLAVDDNLDALPQELVECCADLNSRDALKELTEIMATISKSYHDIKQKIRSLQVIIQTEEENDKEFAVLMGSKRVSPNQLLTEHKREVAKYQEAHETAMNNNQALHSAITQHRDNIALLSQPLNQLLETLPSVAHIESEGDKLTRMEVQRLLNKVSEMQSQRRDLESQLRNDIHQDDITKQLVTNQEDMEQFFDEQLQKHNPLVNLLKQNMNAQVNILQALSETNATYGSARKQINKVKSQRMEMIDSLICSYNTFISITLKANDAKEFYSKLESQVNKVQSKLKSLCKVQEEEREGKLNANIKKFTPKTPQTSLQSTSTGPKLKDFLLAGGKTLPAQALDSSSTSNQTTYPSAPSPYLGGSASPSPAIASPYTPPFYPTGTNDQNSTINSSTGGQKFQSLRGPVGINSYGSNYQLATSYSQPRGFEPTHSQSFTDASNPNNYRTSAWTTQPSNTESSTTSSVNQPLKSSTAPPCMPFNTFQTPYGTVYSQGQTVPSTNTTVAQAESYNPGTSTVSQPISTSYGSTYKQATIEPSMMTYGSMGTPTTTNGQALYGGVAYVSGPTSFMTTVSRAYGNVNGPASSLTTSSQASTMLHMYGANYNFSPIPTTANSQPSSTTMYGGAMTTFNPVPAPIGQSPWASYGSTYSQYHPNSAEIPNTPYQSGLEHSYSKQVKPHYAPATAGNQKNASYSQQAKLPVYSEGATNVATHDSTMYPQGTFPSTYPPSQGIVPSNYPQGTSVPATYPQGTVPTTYPQGTGSAAYSQGTVPASTYPQGTVPTTYPQGTGSAAYSQGTVPASTYPQGTVPATYPQGTVPATYLQATVPTTYPQGTVPTTYPQGTVPATYPQGTVPATYPQGTVPATYLQATVPTTYPQGTVPTTYPQGAAPALYSQGAAPAPYPQGAAPAPYPKAAAPAPYPQGAAPAPYPKAAAPAPYPQGTAPAPYPQGTAPAPYPQGTAPAPYPQGTAPAPYPQGTAPAPYHHRTVSNAADQTEPSKPSQFPQVTQSSKVAKTSGIVSNIDLLSDLDMNPKVTQWSPMKPQQLDSDESVVQCTPSLHGGTTAVDIKANPEDSKTGSPEIRIDSSIFDISKLAKSTNRSASLVDPLSNDEKLNILVSETEKFSKFVQGLDKKPLNGPTNLELKWKELLDVIEIKCADLKVSVGRCYPLSNRFPDILPFDANRVQLPSVRDDYVNASYVKLATSDDNNPLILTQAPLSNTIQDFWTMVWENHSEIIVCLNTDAEVKGQVYYPKDNSLDFGPFTITVKQRNPSPCNSWVQQTLLLQNNSLKSSRVILHIQFLIWPPGAMPESPGPFLLLVNHVIGLQKQQRNKLNPMVVHCISGTGRSGVFALLLSFVKHLQTTGSLMDLWNLLVDLNQQRRMGIQDKAHLLFLYSAALYNAQEALMKRGILTGKTTFEEGPREKTHVRHPSADLLSSDLGRMKAKLGFDTDSPKSDSNLSRSGSQSSILSGGSLVGGTSNGVSLVGGTSNGGSLVGGTPNGAMPNSPQKGPLLPPNLAASLDPNQLDLSDVKVSRITKESFLGPSQGIGSNAKAEGDPFADIDPLWKQK